MDLEVVTPSGYPYAKSVQPELFDRVSGAPRRGRRHRIPTALEMTGGANGAFGYTAFANRCLRGTDPRLGMLAVAERIMLRGNRYALAAALDGAPLKPWVQPCTAVIPRCMCG